MDSLEHRLNETINNAQGHISLCYLMDGTETRIAPDHAYISASIIKLLILITAYRHIEQGHFDKDEVVNLDTPHAHVGGSGVIYYLSPTLRMTLHDVMTLMIIVSDNSASNILLDMLGLDAIAETVNALGLRNTRLGRFFYDPSPYEGLKRNYTTAGDMLQVLKCIGEPNALVSDESRVEMLKMLMNQQFRHKLAAYFPEEGGDIQIYNKTGEIPGIEHDVAILKAGERIGYVAVLSDGWTETAEGQHCLSQIGRIIYTHLLEQER